MNKRLLSAAIAATVSVWAQGALAGTIDGYASSRGDGYIFADPDEGVAEPGLKAVTGDPNNDDFTSPDGFAPQGAQNCLMSNIDPSLVCNAPRGSGKRIKTKLTGRGGFDIAFNVSSSGGTSEYFTYGKLSNLTGARMTGFHLVLGQGTGANFVPVTTSGAAVRFDNQVTLVPPADAWPGAGSSGEGQNPLQRAYFPGGLFGDGGHEGDAGFFSDPDRAGFVFVAQDEGTLVASDLWNSAHLAYFGNGQLSLGMVPEGYFFDDDGDPNTEAALQAWYNASTGQWVDGDNNPIDPATLASWEADPAYSTGPIEDLANLNLNFSLDVGDLPEGTFTLRMIPVFAPIVSASGSDYQFAVAGSLDAARIPYLGASAYLPVVNEIEGMATLAEQQQALDRAGYSFAGAFGTSAFSLGRAQLQQTQYRLDGLRGSTGHPLQNLQPNVASAAPIPQEPVHLASAGSASDALRLLASTGAQETHRTTDRFGYYLYGGGGTGSFDATANGIGWETTSYDLTTGFDYAVDADTLVGVGLGYSGVSADIDDHRGSLDTDGYTLLGYLSHLLGNGAYVDGTLGYSWLNYESERHIQFGSVNETALGDTDGTQWMASLDAGWDMQRDTWRWGPTLSLRHINLNVDPLTETGGGLFNMTLGEQELESTTVAAGLRTAWDLEQSWGFLRPRARVAYVTELEDDDVAINSTFVGPLPTFALPVDARDDNWLTVGLGMSAVMIDNDQITLSMAVDYDGVVANDTQDEHRGTLSLKLAF